jgi:hypothetical protein
MKTLTAHGLEETCLAMISVPGNIFVAYIADKNSLAIFEKKILRKLSHPSSCRKKTFLSIRLKNCQYCVVNIL